MKIPLFLLLVVIILVDDTTGRPPVKIRNPRTGRTIFVSPAGSKNGVLQFKVFDYLSRVRLLGKVFFGHFKDTLLQLAPSRPQISDGKTPDVDQGPTKPGKIPNGDTESVSPVPPVKPGERPIRPEILPELPNGIQPAKPGDNNGGLPRPRPLPILPEKLPNERPAPTGKPGKIPNGIQPAKPGDNNGGFVPPPPPILPEKLPNERPAPTGKPGKIPNGIQPAKPGDNNGGFVPPPPPILPEKLPNERPVPTGKPGKVPNGNKPVKPTKQEQEPEIAILIRGEHIPLQTAEKRK